MWTNFIVAFIVIIAVVFVPGFMLVRSFGASCLWALCSAPAISPALYAILAIFVHSAGLTCNWVTVVLPVLVACFAAYAIAFIKRRATTTQANMQFNGPTWMPLLYLTTGSIVGYFLYLGAMDTPLSIIQMYDSPYHINLIRAFYDSGNWSILHAGQYMTESDKLISPLGSGDAFYPGGWHLLATIAMDLFGVKSIAAMNALIFGFACWVFPLASMLLLDYLFKGNTRHLIIGSVATLVFGRFPWTFIYWGPLLSNMAAYAIVPIVLAWCLIAVDSLFEQKPNSGAIALFFMGTASLAVMQPNAVFFGYILLACYTVQKTYTWRADLPKTQRLLRAGGLVLVYLVIWTILFKLPFFQDVIAFPWTKEHEAWKTLFYIFTMALGSYPRQYILVPFMVIGIYAAIRQKEHRWIVAAVALFAFMFFLDDATDSLLKHYLTGFWFNDSRRIAACLSICAIPLLTDGISIATGWLDTKLKQLRLKQAATIALLGILVPFTMVAFCHNILLPNGYEIRTMAGRTMYSIGTCTSGYEKNIYNRDEVAFVDKVVEAIPEGSLVLNVPDDGSIFSYGMNGLRTYYRDFAVYADGKYFETSQSSENETSRLIRQHIDEVATNKDVQQALKDVGIEYVLVLDVGETFLDQEHVYCFDRVLWTHIQAITEDTPGFSVVLQDGDMALYHMDV